MQGLNKVILIGNIGQQPELKVINQNYKVTKISLATTEAFKNKNGEKVTHTEWHSIIFWGNLAQLATTYLEKGSMVYVEGRIRSRNYELANGVKKHVTEIVGDKLLLMGNRKTSPIKKEPLKMKWKLG